MAHTDGIAAELLNTVAGELRDAFGKQLSPPPGLDSPHLLDSSQPNTDSPIRPNMKVMLCETFAVWRLKPGTIEALAKPGFSGVISDWSEPTTFLHHQVRQDGKLVAYARSRVGEAAGSIAITQYNVSSLVSSVDRAIDVIESHEKDDEVAANDPVVRLLEIPSHHVSALCLLADSIELESDDRNRCVLVLAPRSIYREDRDRLLTSREFFELLKKSGLVRAINSDGTDGRKSDL